MKVLLHICCAPCSCMCIRSLRDEQMDVTRIFTPLRNTAPGATACESTPVKFVCRCWRRTGMPCGRLSAP